MTYISKELHEYEDVNITVLAFDYNGKWFINCYPPEYGEPYFIVYDGSLDQHKRKARISIKEPKYINCSDDPTPEWIMSSDDISELISIMKTNVKDIYKGSVFDMTLWEFMLMRYKNEMDEWAHFEFDVPLDYPMPDYTKLETR